MTGGDSTHTGGTVRAFVAPWAWRKAIAGWTFDTDRGPDGRLFHAYDQDDHAACDPGMGLMHSCEEPNEGSHLCPSCVAVVRSQTGRQP